ncbi:MAG: hypothetical protein CMM62_00240 [Rhodospirillaceae bacterium]|jgi:hypothetical protein|nr:hypothetical protein [Rhodospirillaceae bacterium]MAX65200.1 hypothetical protein [Rhodospirillaceae bacterium]MBB58599.1 hypothetical protein [Rhodospirillaceae bacterium]|tara:strand:- start:751 stop:1005 length:255 start_codon:yes stop_codon:yes gene_type:complete
MPRYTVFVDDEEIGTITPLFKSMESNRPYGYHTHVMLEYDALTDEDGYPNEYRTATEAKVAVAELMRRNGIDPAPKTRQKEARA